MPYVLIKDLEGNRTLVEVSEYTRKRIEAKLEFYIMVWNAEHKIVPLEVSKEIHEIAVDAYREKMRHEHELRDHLDTCGLEDGEAHDQVVTEALEETYQRRELLGMVCDVLETCTPIQQERFHLKYIGGFSFSEIAKSQGCGISRVCKSVEYVVRKLKISFGGGGKNH